MSIDIKKYKILEKNSKTEEPKDNYINPFLIKIIIIYELDLSLSYINLKKMVEEATITIEKSKTKIPDNKLNYLNYIKNYVSTLKEKCLTLLDIIDDINKIKDEKITEQGLKRIKELDLNINESGNILKDDAIRLIEATIYNIKDLNEKVTQGDCHKTYLDHTDYQNEFEKTNRNGNGIYPNKEVQILDIDQYQKKELIALSENQKQKLKRI